MNGYRVEPWQRTPSHSLLFRIRRPALEDFGMWVIAFREGTDEVALQLRVEVAYEDAFVAARETDGVPFDRNPHLMRWLTGAVWRGAVAVAEAMLAEGLSGEQHFALEALEPRRDDERPAPLAPEVIAV